MGANSTALWWVGIASGVAFVATLVVVPILLARMRADYFFRERAPAQLWVDRHPALRAVGRIGKNLLGLGFVVIGILMLVLPGQGVLTILIGVALLDLPGKRRLELRIVRQRHVRRTIDWIRAKAERPPLVFDEPVRRAK